MNGLRNRGARVSVDSSVTWRGGFYPPSTPALFVYSRLTQPRRAGLCSLHELECEELLPCVPAPLGVYYSEDLVTRKQESLHTRDKAEAYRLIATKNETDQQPAFSLYLARVYWKAGDPATATRTWHQRSFPPLSDHHSMIWNLGHDSLPKLVGRFANDRRSNWEDRDTHR